jgi:hypothetical protein
VKAVFVVLWRLFVISFGLICIASGGLCSMLVFTDGPSAMYFALIGMVSAGVGIAVVTQTIRRWQGESVKQNPDSSANKENA